MKAVIDVGVFDKTKEVVMKHVEVLIEGAECGDKAVANECARILNNVANRIAIHFEGAWDEVEER